jgi:hypothetical protein
LAKELDRLAGRIETDADSAIVAKRRAGLVDTLDGIATRLR